MKFQFLFAFLAVVCFSLVQSQSGQNEFPIMKGAYLGQQPPGLEPELFAPGIISTELHDDGPPLFTPDGSEVYFRIAGKPQSMIFKMTSEKGKWSPPVVDPLFKKYQFQFSAFSYDGMKRFFSSKRNPDGSLKKDFDIMFIEKTSNGWSSPKKLDKTINTDNNEFLFCIAKDGTIFFGAEYPNGKGKMDIYCSKFHNGKYSNPENLAAINSKFVDTAPAIAPDGSYMVFSSTRIPATSGINLWVSFKSKDGSWGRPINMGKKINDKFTDKFSGISPDGKFLFWVSHRDNTYNNPKRKWNIDKIIFPTVKFKGGDIYWVSTKLINKLKPKNNYLYLSN